MALSQCSAPTSLGFGHYSSAAKNKRP